MIEIIWKHKSIQYGHILAGYLGKWHCFSITWDATVSRNEPRKYKLICKLPGIKHDIDNFLNEKDSKECAENVKNIWIQKLNEPLT